MEVYKNCPLQYRFKYIEKKRADESSIALSLGSICHAVLEEKGKMLQNGNVDYGMLNDLLSEGNEDLDGVNKIKGKYFETWYEQDNASGATYADKIKTFNEILKSEMEDSEWSPIYFEKEFEFVWDDRIVLHGFIDRIDTKDGEYRTVDYKTSKKVYDSSKLATSLQFGIYALAILNEFGKLPVESLYRFILIDDEQYALTKGWEKRLIKTMDKIFNEIDLAAEKDMFVPKPTPLCHWCSYCNTNPEAKEFKNLCEYYSKWTPNNKTFDVNKKWNETENNKVEGKTRKLVF